MAALVRSAQIPRCTRNDSWSLERILDVWKGMSVENRRLYHYRVVGTLDSCVSTQS